jgi:site-specific DNA-methyltransferase (adenine-specific)
VAACRKLGLPGDAYTFNRLLLRIRKRGKLPKARQPRRRLTFEQMDAYSFASEIAMHLVGLDYRLTLDDILCSPPAAAEFDRTAEKFAPGFSPFEYRWAAMSIRKRARQSRSLAASRFCEWRRRKLPRATPVSKCLKAGGEQAGVYVLAGGGQKLYVGETFNLRARIEQKLETDCWRSFQVESLVLLPTEDDPARQHGLQSVLVERLEPLLNSLLLRPKLDRWPDFGTSPKAAAAKTSASQV